MSLEKIRNQIICELQYNQNYKKLQEIKKQIETLEQEFNNIENNLLKNDNYVKLKAVSAAIKIQDEYSNHSNEIDNIIYSKQEIIENIENFFTQNGNIPKDISTIFEYLKTIDGLKLPSGLNPTSAIGSILRGSKKFNYNDEEKKWNLKVKTSEVSSESNIFNEMNER